MKVEVEEAYRLLHPRPVVLVCSGRNVMACSWVTPVCDEPFMVAVAIWKENYTYELIERSGVFSLNVPTPEMVEAVWIAGTKSGRKVDKIKLANLRLAKAKKIDCYIVEDCVANIECVVRSKVEAGDHVVYIAEALAAYAEEGSFDKVWRRKILMHLGGKEFVTFGEPFTPSAGR
ncbi:MAG: flavin reductase family protein [Archaeoglobaceae archaeon]